MKKIIFLILICLGVFFGYKMHRDLKNLSQAVSKLQASEKLNKDLRSAEYAIEFSKRLYEMNEKEKNEKDKIENKKQIDKLLNENIDKRLKILERIEKDSAPNPFEK